MQPGAHYVYEGTTVEDDGTLISHTVEINVTDLTKVIDGIRTRVTWDTDFSEGELVEAEIAFFAQDKDGTVWRFGEYPEEYDAGEMIDNPGWIHGLQDAQAGILMYADPQTGTPSYAEGWGPAVGWTDRGKVDALGQEVCVPVDCYENVLVIAETSQAEVDAEQLKFYASGVGNIHVSWRGAGEKTQEVLDLTVFEELTGDALTQIRNSALQLEQSALANSPEVYAKSTPIELPEGVEAPTLAPVAATESETQAATSADSPAEIVVYAADLPESALAELEIWDDEASPDGQMIGIANTGDELNSPPELDPHVNFAVPVEEGVGYRCWIHMKVGEPKGASKANLLYVQFDDAVDQDDQEIAATGSASFLTAQGPEEPGWTWVPCDIADAAPDASLIFFGTTGQVNVRIQAGAEGVGFDQFVLSSTEFLTQPPAAAVVEK